MGLTLSMDFFRYIFRTPEPARQPQILKETSPLAGRSKAEQRDHLDRICGERHGEINSDEEDEPHWSVPPGAKEVLPAFELDPPSKRSKRAGTNYDSTDHVPERTWIKVKGAAINDPPVAAALDELFGEDGAGHTPLGKKPKPNPKRGIKKYEWHFCKFVKLGCPKACRISFMENGDAIIKPNRWGHEHPEGDAREELADRKGLPPTAKLALKPFVDAGHYKMVDCIDTLKKGGHLGPNGAYYNEKTQRKFKKMIKNYLTYAIEKKHGKGGRWSSEYGDFLKDVEDDSKTDEEVEAMVANKDWDTPFTFDANISGAQSKNFFCSANIRSLSRAMQQALTGTPQACGDGTGRINLEGRSLVFIGTVDRGQSFHHIAAFLLSKGETKEEILRGLRAISKKIDAVHRAMLRLPAGEALYNASELGAGYTWAPKTVMNDNSDAFFSAWTEIIFERLREEIVQLKAENAELRGEQMDADDDEEAEDSMEDVA